MKESGEKNLKDSIDPVTISMDQDHKIQVLLAQLQERYSASHNMRARGVQFTLWISGMAIGLSWLLIQTNPLSLPQKIALSFLCAALFIGAIYFLISLSKGFNKNREVMITLENALGLYTEGFFASQETVLPVDYSDTKNKWKNHFRTLIVWLAVVALSLFILIWCSPNGKAQPQPPTKVKQAHKEGERNG